MGNGEEGASCLGTTDFCQERQKSAKAPFAAHNEIAPHIVLCDSMLRRSFVCKKTRRERDRN